MSILANAKLKLGISDTSKDDILTLLVTEATSEAVSYCNLTELPTGLEAAVTDMVIVKYRRLGTEGITSQSFSGISESFTDGYPSDITKALNRFRKLRVV